MTVQDRLFEVHPAENVRVQPVVMAFQTWFVSVILAGLPRERPSNQVAVGKRRRGVERVQDMLLTASQHSNHLTVCWMSCMKSVDRQIVRRQG
jgi:hypothetical protein